jgi:hypothetical protein
MTTARELLDRLLDGELDDYLATKKAGGQTFDQIARALEDEHGVKVSRETLRRWMLPTEPEQAAS